MSCNGCRILRKGCSETCILRPCLQWIDTAEAQAHVTVFVAKFFGRADLMSFISAVPENQRPALFRSLLFEAAGRTVSPITGAVGLLSAGHWHVCLAAVGTVLRGGALKPIPEFLGGASGCSDIFKLEDPIIALRLKVQKCRRFPDALTDLDLSLTTGFSAKEKNPWPEKQRLSSPSMNSEESVMTSCGDQPSAETKVLKLFN